MSDSKARLEEERFKELIYESFESDIQSAANEVCEKNADYRAEHYEDQDAFVAASLVARARDVFHATQQRNNAL